MVVSGENEWKWIIVFFPNIFDKTKKGIFRNADTGSLM